MERGLIWFPLLALIIGLTWVGWQEYQKVEGYRIWSEGFDKAKYDIYAVIGLKDQELTWGKPTPKGIANLETFSLADVKEVLLMLGDRQIDAENLATEQTKATKTKAIPQLTFNLAPKDKATQNKTIQIPFTEVDTAHKWQQYLAQNLSEAKS